MKQFWVKDSGNVHISLAIYVCVHANIIIIKSIKPTTEE